MTRKRTKIIATVGPASSSPETLRALVEAGVNVFRINFSHGDQQQREEFFENIRNVEQELQLPVAICGDLCGPKIRTGMIAGGKVVLEAERQIVIQRAPVVGNSDRISTTLPELVDVVGVGNTILLNDGRLKFEVTRALPPDEITARIIIGGTLSSGRGINLPQTELKLPALTEKDRQDIDWIARHQLDYVALSFVRSAADVAELRELLLQHNCAAHIITKIEKPQALEQIDAIIDAADAVMVARGDLGVEMDFPAVPVAQKMIVHKCQLAGKPCIIATEMLESMITAPRPTRAEVSDVANAVFDQADAVMLSAESAIGKYPVESVTAMSRVILAAEQYADTGADCQQVIPTGPKTTAALAGSIRSIMDLQDFAAVGVFSVTGTSARLISKNRPKCPVVAISADPITVRRSCLYYGVVPRLAAKPENVQNLTAQFNSLMKDLQIAATGDRIILLAGRPIGSRDRADGLLIEVVD